MYRPMTPLRGQPVHGRGDDPRHVPEQEEGEERDEDREQEQPPACAAASQLWIGQPMCYKFGTSDAD
jgi:hypothetical protein